MSTSNMTFSRDREYEEDRDVQRDKTRDSRQHPSERERESGRDRDRDRDRERDKHHERERPRERERERERERDRDRDRDYSTRSSRTRSRHHSRSQSRSPPQYSEYDDDVLPLDQWPKKLKNWDVPPKGFEGMTVEQVKSTGLFIPPAIQPKVTNLTPFVDPTRTSLIMQAVGGEGSDLTAMVANINPVMAKQSRRVYAGGLPPHTTESDVANFFNDLMRSYNVSSSTSSAVSEIVLNTEKGYAFVDFKAPEEATAAMSFDGIAFMGSMLKIRRPKDYQPTTSDSGGVNMISTMVPDTPHKIFIGGIPFNLNEDEIIELLKPFGDLKAFHLVRENPTGQSKGYAFCEYVNPEVTDIACEGLNQLELGDKRLIVQRASIGSNKATAGQATFAPTGLSSVAAALPNLIGKVPSQPSTVVQLLNMVSPDELVDDEEYQDILEDVKSECRKFGTIVDIVIPRPTPEVPYSPAIGKIFIQYHDKIQATAALQALAGRKFADKTVLTAYYPLELFERREF